MMVEVTPFLLILEYHRVPLQLLKSQDINGKYIIFTDLTIHTMTYSMSVMSMIIMCDNIYGRRSKTHREFLHKISQVCDGTGNSIADKIHYVLRRPHIQS